MRYQVCLVDKFTFHGGQHRHHRAGHDVTDHPAERPRNALDRRRTRRRVPTGWADSGRCAVSVAKPTSGDARVCGVARPLAPTIEVLPRYAAVNA
jgi:hypothetical protein